MAPRLYPALPGLSRYARVDQIRRLSIAEITSLAELDQAEFAALRYFALNGTDHRSHTEQDAAIDDYIRWHNQRARPKTGYATDSKIRHPDYPLKAA
ncbi:hypothetical protein [Pseudosporangium ferrugineum]|uniref:Integrase-like protein n=1 Tax=Pseudosporangium ferrugineum TaxID=439699 RepID=A0A2T0RFB9_9ACTN|nr:hypothetical protein [Pseudosporangium ferrugineum]PRY19904.1 hypothetical protein CLV70_12729 [Pseudosporangium ferrugineum]